jgi:copper oxidase (laccase) domain-containing protein
MIIVLDGQKISLRMIDMVDFSFSGLNWGVTRREYPASSLFYQSLAYRYWVSMKQVHSAECVVVGPEHLKENKHVVIEHVDAIVTKEPGVLLSVRTADCLPILIAHESGVIGVVHAGRKGTQSEIIVRTLEKMDEAFGPLDALKFWFGPAICERCYQIDRETNLHFDLVGENRKQIDVAMGARSYEISECGICTMEDDVYYSYRREGDLAGRLQSYLLRGSR